MIRADNDSVPYGEQSSGDRRMTKDEIKQKEMDKDNEVIRKLASEASKLVNNTEMDDVQKMYEREEQMKMFPKKWSGPILLGAFVPAMFGVFVIFSGQIVVNYNDGMCFYPLNTFISVEIALNYLFLVLYSWIFLGENMSIKIESMKINWHVLAPFSSLDSIIIFYWILGIMTFLLTAVGTFLLFIANSCYRTAQSLYLYVAFIIFINWIGMILIGLSLIRLRCSNITHPSIFAQKTRVATIAEVEETLFLKKFRQVDRRKKGFMKVEVSTDIYIFVIFVIFFSFCFIFLIFVICIYIFCIHAVIIIENKCN